jgi:hypothetical protein
MNVSENDTYIYPGANSCVAPICGRPMRVAEAAPTANANEVPPATSFISPYHAVHHCCVAGGGPKPVSIHDTNDALLPYSAPPL